MRQADEDETLHLADVDAAQSEVVLVEFRLHPAPGDEAAIELVGPLVIRADELDHVPGGLGALYIAKPTA